MADNMDKFSGSTYAAAQKYVQEALDGVGALAGKPCVVKSVDDTVAGQHTVVLGWTSDSGVEQETSFVVYDGAKGDTGATGPQGAQGIQGERGPQGVQGIQGATGSKGDKGDKGDDGYPFLIYKQYDTISEFDASDFPEVGLMFMVMTAAPNEGYPVYRYTAESPTPYSLVTYLASEGIKGEKGDKGDKGDTGDKGADGAAGQDGTTYIPEIGTVTTLEPGNPATASVSTDATTGKATFNFGIPKGRDGDSSIVYYPAGSVTFSQLPILTTDKVGAVYDITDSFTSTSSFTDGGGKTYPAGTDVAIVNVGTVSDPVLKYNCLSGGFEGEEISSVSTGTSITLTDAADARVQELKIKGNSAVVSGDIVSVGDNGLAVTIAQTGQTSRTITLTSGLPLRSVSAGVYDMLDAAAGVVSKKCAEIDLSTLAWETSSTPSVFIGKGLSPACVNDDAAEQGVCAEYTVSSVNKLYANTAGNMALGVSNNRVYLRNDTYTDAASLTTALLGVKLVYPLATPTETALTAAEMTAWRAFRTFEGNNTISATDSPEMTVTYIKNTDNGKALERVQNDADTQLAGKVDKVQGKGLSTEDYTTAEKTKLAGVATGATANTVFDTTCTLTVAGWTGATAPYTQTVNVTDILSTDEAWCDLSVSSTVATGLDEIDDWALISKIESGAGTLTFSCYEEKPTTELNVNVKVVR